MAFLMAPFVLAQTPDGQSPAEETVCDPLRADGVSKGLYGLCVAFCEAQDHASADTPITEDDLELLEADAPSGRILANFNKMKQEADPPMPCILVEESCPCWSAAEMSSIGDGIATTCLTSVDTTTGLIDARRIRDVPTFPAHWATAWDVHRSNGGLILERCEYRNSLVSPAISRTLSVRAGTLTHELAIVCLEEVNTRCAETGH